MQRLVIAAILATTLPAAAEPGDDLGTLNPDEMTWNNVLDRAERGETSMTICATGYMLTKSGRHDAARTLFENCAAAGYTQSMTWMSYMEQNGFGGDYNPDAAAEWDLKAAQAGDPVGQFNYGLDLMRGHGTTQDAEQGRAMVDAAAAQGLQIARDLQASEYDLDSVTPDADNWRYAPAF